MISFKNHYVFVHIPKTAGTSIKHYLAGYDLAQKNIPNPADIRFLYTHYTACSLRGTLTDTVGGDKAKDFFQFAFVRNPWDRLISTFIYLQSGGSGNPKEQLISAVLKPFHNDFSQFVKKLLPKLIQTTPQFFPQYTWTHAGIDPATPLDFIGRYENLKGDFEYVAQQLQFTQIEESLPHLRRTDHKSYVEYYDEDAKAIVAKLYEQDIKLFNYRFSD